MTTIGTYSADDWEEVTPSDSVDLPGGVSRAVYVGTGGDLACLTAAGNVRVITVGDGTLLPIRAKRVRATATTASNITVLY